MAGQGFFTKEETASVSIGKQVLSCPSCGLYKNAMHPKMGVWGNGNKKILIIGEAPEEQDDRKGKPWQWKAGRHLKRVLSKYGVDLFEDCWTIHAVNCHIPNDEDGKPVAPELHQIACCRSKVWDAINEYKPVLIIPLGIAAMQSLLSHRWKEAIGSMHKWRGWQIPDRETKCWVCPTFNPGYANEVQSAKAVFRDDIEKALDYAGVQYPYDPDFGISMDEDDHIIHLPDNEDADKILMELYRKKPALIEFDYETTGLKPHAEGHKIVMASLATTDECFTFWYPHGFKAFRRILRSKDIGKMAHNMKFEHMWTAVILGYEVVNWEWDSMLSSRLMNNLPGVSGLKFQVYVRMGVADYSSDIEHYLKSPGKDANEFNNILQAPVPELRKYGGLDSRYGYDLAMKHRAFLNREDYQ